MIRIAVALVALFLFVPMAQAASFDCAKASTSFEKAICAHPELSSADELLAKAYATAIGGLSTAALDSVKADQHAWLGYAAHSCSDDAQPIPGDYTDDQASCLRSVIESRITDLEASRMQGSYRFYPVQRYLVEKDEEAEPDAYTKTASKQFSTVKIDATDDLAKAFNAMTEAMRLQATDLFKKGTDQIDIGDTTTDVVITTTVTSVNDYRISLATDNYWFGHGAAHGNYGVTYAHFLVKELRPLYASDIFSGKNWKETLGKLVAENLKSQLEDGMWNDAESDVIEHAADPSRWDFSREGLIVQFQPYEVTAYAAGAPTAVIPWDKLNDILSSGGEAIATY
ncbi:MAG: DUF3298 domain-containing protein [Devosia sp.]